MQVDFKMSSASMKALKVCQVARKVGGDFS